MSDINDIVQVNISRETQALSLAGFGVPAVIAEFLTSKTTPAFGRTRTYSSTTEMITDGWTTSDNVYKAAQIIFSQNPKVPKILVGRKDALDADWDAALSAIQDSDADWYTFTVTDELDADLPDIMAWAETQIKIFFATTSDVNAYSDVATTDIGYIANNTNYDRTACYYHPNGATSFFAEGSCGEALPYDPGSQTWAFKTIAGVTSYNLTSAQRTALLNKKYNIFTKTAGVANTEFGTVASGEYIDIIRGVDWLKTVIQEEVFINLINKRKVPYTDEGIALVKGAVTKALGRGVAAGLLEQGTITVTAPLKRDIPTNDIINRNLPDVTFTAVLQGAIHTVKIEGTVTPV